MEVDFFQSKEWRNNFEIILKKLKPDYVACDCETCKWQIEMSTGKEVKNPISILAEALDLVATSEANK